MFFKEKNKKSGTNDATVFSGNATGSDQPCNHSEKPVSIEKGATLLGQYSIESEAMCGGLSQVFRVRHLDWNVDLAMKQPKSNFCQNENEKARFTKQCELWLNLGKHPHIVTCYYTREINGIPSAFAEWVDGGSLNDWIDDGRLYENDKSIAIERILDISIQIVRGLYYIHEKGLIHADVKPNNMLLTSAGKVKVAGFTIATHITGSPYHAYTLAYYSPEQKDCKKITQRTDIWSWAVSVLEMFMGKRWWQDGNVAGYACEDYFAMEMRVPMPETMKDLLRHCLKINEAERPRDFAEIEKILLKIYEVKTGSLYGIFPKATEGTVEQTHQEEELTGMISKCEICGEPIHGENNKTNICEKCEKDPVKVMRFLVKDDIYRRYRNAPKIAGYSILKMLGEGNKAQVWYVEEEATGMQMAMKHFSSFTGKDKIEQNRLLYAVMLESQLNHKNIVQLYKSEQSGNDYFILMEMCGSGTVDAFIRKNKSKLHIDLATNIILHVLDGLIYAHDHATVSVQLEKGRTTIEHGIVHGNLCLSNILLTGSEKDFTAKIADFGHGKACNKYARTDLTGIPQLNAPMFKPRQQIINTNYSKPDLDVWAAAASYYAMLTGFYPKNFTGNDIIGVALTGDPVPIRQRNASIPVKLAKVIDHALIENPEIGVQSAAELKKMIESAIE